MRKKIVIVIFLLAVAALALLYFGKSYFKSTNQEVASAKLIVPDSGTTLDGNKDSSGSIKNDDIVLTSLIPLKGDEVLINVVSADLNDDGLEDQINIIKSGMSPYLQLLVGIYNSKTEVYERTALIATRVSQQKTFSCYGLDLSGRGRTALVYQGFTVEGNSILQAFCFDFDSKKDGYTFRSVANMESDGAIYIQQKETDNVYTTSSPSFSVMVYSSDGQNESGDQIQTQWDWSEREQKYIEIKKTRIRGSHIAAQELSKIQDGTVKTFADYLGGLWYKMDKSSQMRYVFFDYGAKQIVFFMGEEEEVYNWENSSLHYRGLYVSTTNFEIINLKRNININLVELDKINLLVNDDVKMVITEGNVWNGEYRKVKFSETASSPVNVSSPVPDFIANLEKGPYWNMSDGTRIEFSGGSYNAVSAMGDVTYKGTYVALEVGDDMFVQFRSGSDKTLFDGNYMLVYSPSIDDDTKVDENRVILQAYKMLINNSYSMEERPLIITRAKGE